MTANTKTPPGSHGREAGASPLVAVESDSRVAT